MTPFHDSNSVYAEGVHIDTAELPAGWRDRLVTWELRSSEPAAPKFIEPHYLVVSKLVTRREKDIEFAASLLDANPMDVTVLLQRAAALRSSSARVIAWLQRYQRLRG